MTGYGKAVVAFNSKKIHAEVKSLNSKQLDLQTRIAPLYREKEMEIRQMIAQQIERGKVDFALWIEQDTGVEATPVNGALIDNYYRQLKAISRETGIPEPEDYDPFVIMNALDTGTLAHSLMEQLGGRDMSREDFHIWKLRKTVTYRGVIWSTRKRRCTR